MEGRPLHERTDSFPTLTTPLGRTLRADGGIYPDLVVQDDTLTSKEQNFVLEAARAEIPLTLRITEFAFDHAKRAQEGTGPEELDPSSLEGFYRQLEAEGLANELVEDPAVQAYLDWRVRMAFAQRAEEYDDALEFQAERDRVLAAAIRLLEETGSQAELFATVASEAGKENRAQSEGR